MIDFALAFKSHMNEGIVLCFGKEYDQKIYQDFDFGLYSMERRPQEMVTLSYYIVEFLITRFGMSHKLVASNVLAYSKRGYHRMHEKCAKRVSIHDKEVLFAVLDKRLDNIFKKVNKGRPLITVDECGG